MNESMTYLPVAVGVSTNIMPLCPLETVHISSKELSECFLRAQQSNSHTRPVPSAMKEIKRTLDKLDSFHSSQLDIFLRAYMFAGNLIPTSILNEVRLLCVNCNRDWVTKCQNLALTVLTSELYAKRQNVIPRSHPDDPLSLSQLRSTLPTLKHVPEITINTCHFCFTANFNNTSYDNFRSVPFLVSSSSSSALELSPESSTACYTNSEIGNSNNIYNTNSNSSYNNNRIKMTNEVYTGKVKLTNSGRHTITLSVWQTQTVIDGVSVENKFIETSIEKQVLRAKESMEMTLTLKEAPRTGFSDFQQLIVLGIDGVLKVFITFTVICPRQVIFHQRFPNCLPLQILHSPIGNYDAPLMLQILKHALIKQKGLSDPSVMNLFVCNSANYHSQNTSIISQALRVQEILSEQMNLNTILESFWASQKLSRKDVELSKHRQLPASAAQPAGYLPGIDLPTKDNVSIERELFPNESTKVPDVLTRAPAPVIMCLILLWLSSLDVVVFDNSFTNCDPEVYLETVFPHIRGIILWVVDLCCAFLINAPVNGCTVRDLAITFAAILDRTTQLSSNSSELINKTQQEYITKQKHVDVNDSVKLHSTNTPTYTKKDDTENNKIAILSDAVINQQTSENNRSSGDNATNTEHQVNDGRAGNNFAIEKNNTIAKGNGGDDNNENYQSNTTSNSAKGEELMSSIAINENIQETSTVESTCTDEQSKLSSTSVVNPKVNNNFQMCVIFRQNIVTALITWISLYRTRYDALYECDM